jgi:uncharacterized protein involved in exopolysaccharide biosynthesis
MEEEFQEVKLREILNILLKEKILIFFVTLFFTISSVIYALFLNDIYKSEATLFPKEEEKRSMGSQISGLASLAGINVSSNKKNLFVYIETLKSRKFHEHLISFPGVLENLIAVSSYDKTSKEIIFDKNLFDKLTGKWSLGKKPTTLEAHEFLLENLKIDREIKTGIIKISFKHESPIFAKDFLDLVLKEFHELTIEKDLTETEKSLNYLNEKFLTSKASSLKSSISQMMEEQLQRQMMIKFKEDYVFQIVDPPFIPEQKVEPLRSQIVIFSFLMGIFLSFSIVFIRFIYLKKT